MVAGALKYELVMGAQEARPRVELLGTVNRFDRIQRFIRVDEPPQAPRSFPVPTIPTRTRLFNLRKRFILRPSHRSVSVGVRCHFISLAFRYPQYRVTEGVVVGFAVWFWLLVLRVAIYVKFIRERANSLYALHKCKPLNI